MFTKLRKNMVIIYNENLDKEEALERIIKLACTEFNIPDCDEIFSMVFERETKLSTGIGLEIAVPHCRSEQVQSVITAAMLVPSGIEYNSIDGKPVKLIFLIISPINDIQGHIACLSAISHAISDESTRLKLLNSTSSDKLYENLAEIGTLI